MLPLQALSWAFNPDTGTVESWQGWLPRGATTMYKQLVIVGEQAPLELCTPWMRRQTQYTSCCRAGHPSSAPLQNLTCQLQLGCSKHHKGRALQLAACKRTLHCHSAGHQ
eukprot:GHRQ01038102.1.p3 GENE.GHRQ01038102.1~~GHRQ01038102.1.p3  ORF type:complete len:110 (+),score=24.67 GHRQ01038102.1:136-465(+)